VRTLLVFLLLGAIAVAVALFARISTGYVLFVAPPYRLELSVNAFLLLLAALFVAVYAIARFAARLARLPSEVREHRRAQHVERARAKQDAAVVGLLEGRYGRARQAADEALAIPRSSGLAALIGAKAALEMRDFGAVESLLARADAQVRSLAVPRMMIEAEAALEQGRTADALARLAELKREAGMHTAALRLELRTLTQAGRHAETPALIDQLHKRKVYDAGQAELLRAAAHAEALRALGADPGGLRA
jgi:HemY protein